MITPIQSRGSLALRHIFVVFSILYVVALQRVKAIKEPLALIRIVILLLLLGFAVPVVQLLL